MKKFLIAACISLMVASTATATETYTGALLNSVQKKIDAKAAPIVSKEAKIREQADIKAQGQKQISDKQSQLYAKQQAQLELVNKKKQQVQAQKDALKKEKDDIKSLFTIK